MAHGLRRSAFDQSSYDYWTGQYGILNAKDFGAVGNGSHDDTEALQAWIDAAQTSHSVAHLPPGDYLISSAIQITGNVRIQGTGCYELFGSQGDDPSLNNSINFPQDAPYLQGAVLVVSAPDINAIEITAASAVVDLTNFGIRFATPYANTGHGIYAVPPAITAGGYDNGVMSSEWKNLKVFGHDGNHYAFYLVNPIYMTLTNLRYYGGGGVYLNNDSGVGAHYGNIVLIHPYGQVYVGGSAHGYRIQSTTAYFNLLAMIRPQVTVADYSISGVTPPTSSQYTFKADADVANFSIMQGDFETNVGAGVQRPTTAQWMDPASYIPTTNTFYLTYSQYVNGKHGTRAVDNNLQFSLLAYEPSGYIWSFGQDLAGSSPIQQGPYTDGSGGWYVDGKFNNALGTTTLAGTTAGNIYWSQPEQGTRKIFIAYFDGYENDTTTDQTITFPTSYNHTPTVSTNSTGLSFSVDTTTLTIKAPDSTTTYSGVVEVVGI